MPRVLAWSTIVFFARRYGIALSVRGRPRSARRLLQLIYEHEQRYPPSDTGLYVNALYENPN